MPLLLPDTDAATLHARIRSGQLLVACLCGVRAVSTVSIEMTDPPRSGIGLSCDVV